jgi:hypothetical protein
MINADRELLAHNWPGAHIPQVLDPKESLFEVGLPHGPVIES